MDGVTARVAAAFGIAVSSPGGADAMGLMRDADVALYRAKAASDHPIELYDEELHREAVRVMVIRNDLRWAAERGQLLLEYQPIIELETSRPIAFEALLRWDASRPGPPPPRRVRTHRGSRGSHGRDRSLGHQRSVSSAAAWQAEGHADRSQRQPRAQPAARRVAVQRRPGALDTAGLAPHWLVLEVTESVLGPGPRCPGTPGGAPGVGGRTVHRRLRHRILLARARGRAAGPGAQDRPFVAHGRPADAGRGPPVRHVAGSAGGDGGRRDAEAAGDGATAGVRGGAGVSCCRCRCRPVASWRGWTGSRAADDARTRATGAGVGDLTPLAALAPLAEPGAPAAPGGDDILTTRRTRSRRDPAAGPCPVSA